MTPTLDLTRYQRVPQQAAWQGSERWLVNGVAVTRVRGFGPGGGLVDTYRCDCMHGMDTGLTCEHIVTVRNEAPPFAAGMH